MAGRILLSPGINATRQRANYPEIKHLRLSYYDSFVPFSNVECENIGSYKLIFVRTKVKS